MWQDNNNAYGAAGTSQYYGQAGMTQPGVPLQFYAPSPVGSSFYTGSRPSLDGNPGVQGSMQPQGGVQPGPGYGGNIQSGGWWTAFGTGGVEGEPPLLEGMWRIQYL
jgi:protein YIPF5/7